MRSASLIMLPGATMLAASALAAADPPLTINQLLAQGWEIAGYAHDVTRNPRTVVNCYELQ